MESYSCNEELSAATPEPFSRLLARLIENSAQNTRLSEGSKQGFMNYLHAIEAEQHESRRLLEQEQHVRRLLQQKLFDEKYVRACTLVGMPQPSVAYNMKRNGGTESATARVPSAVIEWDGFEEQQREFTNARQQYFETIGFIPRVNMPPSIMKGDKCVLRCEKNLQSLTDEWLHPIENRLTLNPESEFFLITSSKEKCGMHFQSGPDGVTVLWQRGTASEKAKLVRATNCWENKPECIFKKGSNVVSRWENEMSSGKPGPIFRLVTQVVGNMIAMKAKTACINTGVQMIGMMLMDDGVLMITPAVSSEATGLDSTWNFIDYILNSPEAWRGFTEIPDLPAASTKIKLGRTENLLEDARGLLEPARSRVLLREKKTSQRLAAEGPSRRRLSRAACG